MPPKKSKQKQQQVQPTLNNFINNEQTEQNPTLIDQKIEKEYQKLLKIRKDMQQKKKQEDKVLKNLLNLQITQNNIHPNQMEDEKDEQYWIMTQQPSIDLKKMSVLKLLLSDYGSIVTNKSQEKTKPSQRLQLEDSCTEEVRLWQQRGIMNQKYLQSYTPDFIHSLQEYQYIAQDVKQTADIL